MRIFPTLALLSLAAAAVAQPVPQPPPFPPLGPGGTSAPAPATPDGKLPDGVRLRLGTSKFREPSSIQAAALSPDGKLVAIGNGSQLVRFLDVATGKEDHRIMLSDYPRTPQIAWSPDGTRVVMSGQQGVGVWDAKTGHLVKQVPAVNRNGGQEGPVQVSDDGKFAAVGHMYQNGAVRVVDLENGSQVSVVQPAQNAAVSGALSPKGETLATWGQHYNQGKGTPEDHQRIARTIQLWDAKEGKEKASLVSDIYQVASVRFSPDGSRVAAGGNGVVQLWEVATGKLERRFAGRAGQGTQLVFSPDGKVLTAAGQDGCVQSWEVATGKRAGICEGPVAAVAGLRYRPDGQLLAWAANANALEIWEVPSGKRLTPQGGHTAPVSALQFAPDNKTLVSCGQDGKVLRWDIATGAELDPFELKESPARRRAYGSSRPTGQSSFSPNGKYLIANGSNGALSVWDVESGLELFALTSAGGYVNQGGIVSFSGDSTKLLAMNRYGGGQNVAHPIPIWDLESGAPLPPLQGQKGDFTCGAFSTDGSVLVTVAYTYHPQGGQVSEAWGWDVATGKALSKVALPPNAQVQSVQFLDHRLYAVFGYNQQPNVGYKVYDAVTGREARTLERSKDPNQQPGTALALSPDRRLLAYGPMTYDYSGRGGQARQVARTVVWEVATGSIRHEFGGIDGHITALAFSRDGRTLAAGCSDTTIYLWDLAPKADRAESLSAGDLDKLWKTLEGLDAKAGVEALRALTARPAEAVPFLKEQLKPVPGVKPDAAKIQKMIADLDSPRYPVREAAMRDLERLGGLARAPVQAALQKATITAEVRERLEKLADAVNKPDTGAEWVRPLRAVEALERIGTPDAVAHLKDVAAGGDAPPTRMAREALGRLGVK